MFVGETRVGGFAGGCLVRWGWTILVVVSVPWGRW